LLGIACTADNCFAFLNRIKPVETRREPLQTPQLPFSSDAITQAGN
jgi:hypothetical protein